MWIDGTSFAVPLLNPKVSKVHDQVEFANSPIAVTPKGSHLLWGWGLAIPSSSKSYDEAFKFITWATSPEYTKLASIKEGWLGVPPGVRISTFKNPNYRAVAPDAEISLQAIQTADPRKQTLLPVPYTGIQFVAIPEFPALGGKVSELLAEVLADKKTIDRALKEAQEFVTAQMKASGYTK